MLYRLTKLFFLLFTSSTLFAQTPTLQYRVEALTLHNSSTHPAFWAISNKQGIYSNKRDNYLIRAGVFKEYDSLKKSKLNYAYGLDVYARYDVSNTIHLQQAYLKLKFHFITLQGGMLEEKFGNQDSLLSSGGLLWSGNAAPMPKIGVGIMDYRTVPFSFGLVEIKGAIAHSWFDNKTSYVKDAWLHHKYAYLRLGGKLPVKIHGGLQHFVQWGGISPKWGRLPSSFNDFIIVATGKQVDGDTLLAGDNQALFNEYSNRIGNHIASRNFGMNIDLKKINIDLYYQTFIEDNSGKKWQNAEDGLWGISIQLRKNKWLNRIVYEYLYSYDQASDILYDTFYLNNNYFNNGVYQTGWSHKGYGIGTPLITSPVFTDNYGPQSGFKNNMVESHHIGLAGKFSGYSDYVLLFTYSINGGTIYKPYPNKKESYHFYAGYTHTFKKVQGLKASLVYALDRGDMYGSNEAVLLSIAKKGVLFSK